MTIIFHGRCNIWWSWSVIFVARATFNDFGMPLFVAGAAFGDVGLSLFVQAHHVVKFGRYSRRTKCCIFHTKCVTERGKNKLCERTGSVLQFHGLLWIVSHIVLRLFVAGEAWWFWNVICHGRRNRWRRLRITFRSSRDIWWCLSGQAHHLVMWFFVAGATCGENGR